MKMSEIHGMDDDALDKAVEDKRDELLKLRFQLATGALENTSRVTQVKREIARLLTVRSSRSGSAATAVVAAAPAGAAQETESSDG